MRFFSQFGPKNSRQQKSAHSSFCTDGKRCTRDIIGVLSDPDMIEKQSSVRKQQTETAGKVVLDNMSKAKKT
ncbi:hypothetical protein DPMN_029792 [Dreissena polymorpha]|uniref:Uncharacterized protein n=1 Tax=Dreissena polymorpha TaxID=45954 RepID=A0A9D4LXW4_DREPO|nr:hypothetical protein DPMN_029792 [Dreissena polymorpha]